MRRIAAVPNRHPVTDRTRLLLAAPITPTLLRLAIPNVVVMVAQAVVSTCEMYFVGWLGPDALAGADRRHRGQPDHIGGRQPPAGG